MFIYSLKASTVKFVGMIVFSVVALALIIGLLPSYDNSAESFAAVNTGKTKITYDGIKTPEDRLEFIKQFGIEVLPEINEEVTAKVPKKFDSIFEEYNNIQKSQGFDLKKYRNKDVTRYTYEVTNYPKNSESEPNGKVFLNLLVYRNRIVGGDICTAEMGGLVEGFTKFNI